MVLSSNYNGKVYKTSSAGYSVKVTLNMLIKFLKSIDVKYDFEIARTGSSYIKFTIADVYYDIRISNHTKRTSCGYEEVETNVVVDESMCWINPCDRSLGKELYKSCDFSILNTESKKAFFSHIVII